jgi:hypothetical protein
MGFWSGYWRYVRQAGRCRRVFVRRAICKPCSATHALLPSFLLVGRRDVAETIGAVVEQVASASSGARPAAEQAEVPHTTARGWLRRFARRAQELAVAFAALSVELGGEVVVPSGVAVADALAAVAAAFAAAGGMPGWAAVGRWRFVSAVSGGRAIAANTLSPYLVLGRARFMPPVP